LRNKIAQPTSKLAYVLNEKAASFEKMGWLFLQMIKPHRAIFVISKQIGQLASRSNEQTRVG
jgi:hypothetical protein